MPTTSAMDRPVTVDPAPGGRTATAPLRVAIVTNMPAPYRVPVYEGVARTPGLDVQAIFCASREPDRHWAVPEMGFRHRYLKQRILTFRGRFIHFNPDAWQALREFRPDVVVTDGYNPTHLVAHLYARLNGAAHVCMTDGTRLSEARLTAVHRFVRRRVFAGSQAFVGAADGSRELYADYGIAPERMHKSHLCANNAAFVGLEQVPKRYDLMFCGRIEPVKNPMFALDVAEATASRLGRPVSICFVGSGAMEAQVRARGEALKGRVEVAMLGFASQADLPQRYAASRLFLFPTTWDPWGVVANEACAAGLPVLVSPHAGVVPELVADGDNGRVLELDVGAWGHAAAALLSDPVAYARASQRSRERVAPYTYDNAAAGLVAGIREAAAAVGR